MTTLEKIKLEITSHFLWDGEVKTDIPYTVQVCLDIIDKYAEQEPCDDAISRQAVLDVIERRDTLSSIDPRLIDKIKRLPSVRPQEQTGHWTNKEFRKEEYVLMGKCSVCGRGRVIDGFCSYCGCRMVEPQESEEGGEQW